MPPEECQARSRNRHGERENRLLASDHVATMGKRFKSRRQSCVSTLGCGTCCTRCDVGLIARSSGLEVPEAALVVVPEQGHLMYTAVSLSLAHRLAGNHSNFVRQNLRPEPTNACDQRS
jgi:hypothetical protein